MILTGSEIISQVAAGKIVIEPFSATQVTTNSYDLRLGNEALLYEEEVLDPAKINSSRIIQLNKEGFVMQKGQFVLAATKEIIGSNYFVPIIHGRSSIARLGLFVHVTADLIDIGSIGMSTLQLYATAPIRIYPNQLIAQVTFWTVQGEIELYAGKYQRTSQVTPSKSYLDFKNDPYQAENT